MGTLHAKGRIRIAVSNIEYIADHRPHVVVQGCGRIHVIPESFFEDVIAGRRKISDLEDVAEVVPAILTDWLRCMKGLCDD